MKRLQVILVCGSAIVVVAYFVFPSFFRYLQRSSTPKHVDVNTTKAAAIHIATSDPKTSLLIFEENGVVSVTMTKTISSDDYIDTTMSIGHDSTKPDLILSNRRAGVLTILKRSDSDGMPTRKSIGTKGDVRSFERKSLEWIAIPLKD